MKQVSIKSLKSNYNIIDIRDFDSYQKGHVFNAINIEMNDLLSNMNLLNKNEVYYIYCKSGYRSKKCCEILSNFGFKVVNVFDGYDNY